MFRYVFMLALSCTTLVNYAGNFVAGKDYEIFSASQATPADKILVQEFFSYGCHWCFQLEPGVAQWVKQQNGHISFIKVPVVFNQGWELYAKAYYTSVALGIEPKMSPLLFKAINTDKLPLNSNKAFIDFFIKNGVSPSIAYSAFSASSSIDMQVNHAQQLMASYQVHAIPTFVINNKFKTNLQMAQTEERLFEILNFLIKQ